MAVADPDPPAVADASKSPPGELLQHMRLPPRDPEALQVAGGSGLGLSARRSLHSLRLAGFAGAREAWQNVVKDGMGFIVDPSEEQVWKAKAPSLSDQILALMDVDGRRARAVRCRVVLVLKDFESRRYAIGFKVSVM